MLAFEVTKHTVITSIKIIVSYGGGRRGARGAGAPQIFRGSMSGPPISGHLSQPDGYNLTNFYKKRSIYSNKAVTITKHTL